MPGARVEDLLSRTGRALRAAVDPVRGVRVEGGVIQVVGVEGALGERDGVVAERGGALRSEPADGTDDLRRILRSGLAIEQRPVAGEGLALRRREPVVVPEVHRGGDDAVRRAAGEEERVQRRE